MVKGAGAVRYRDEETTGDTLGRQVWCFIEGEMQGVGLNRSGSKARQRESTHGTPPPGLEAVVEEQRCDWWL